MDEAVIVPQLSQGFLSCGRLHDTDDDGKIVRGKVGADVTQAEAKAFARNSGLRLLSTIEAAVGGDMDRVEQVLNLTGLVNATEDFNAFCEQAADNLFPVVAAVVEQL